MHFLALTIESANGLKKPTLCSTPKPYVRASIIGNSGTLRTNTDTIHGSDPAWGFGFKIDLQQPYPPGSVVQFEIMHHSSTKIDRSMGKVKVPLIEFAAGEGEKAQKLSYGVCLSSGETRGELVISHQQIIINNPAPMMNAGPPPGDEEVQPYLPTLEFLNDASTPSRFSPSDGIGWFGTCLGIGAHVQDIAADGFN